MLLPACWKDARSLQRNTRSSSSSRASYSAADGVVAAAWDAAAAAGAAAFIALCPASLGLSTMLLFVTRGFTLPAAAHERCKGKASGGLAVCSSLIRAEERQPSLLLLLQAFFTQAARPATLPSLSNVRSTRTDMKTCTSSGTGRGKELGPARGWSSTSPSFLKPFPSAVRVLRTCAYACRTSATGFPCPRSKASCTSFKGAAAARVEIKAVEGMSEDQQEDHMDEIM